VGCPQLCKLLILCIRFLAKPIKLGKRLVFRSYLIDLLEVSGGRFVVFPRDVFQAIANHVNNAKLSTCLGVVDRNRVWEAIKPIDAGNQNVFNAAIL